MNKDYYKILYTAASATSKADGHAMMIIMRFWCVLLLLTTSSVHVSALSRADFSVSLLNAVADMLGSDKSMVAIYSIVVIQLLDSSVDR